MRSSVFEVHLPGGSVRQVIALTKAEADMIARERFGIVPERIVVKWSAW